MEYHGTKGGGRMRGKIIGLVLIALGMGILLALVLPVWVLVLFLALGMVAVGFIICR
jgi:hypothetical protein